MGLVEVTTKSGFRCKVDPKMFDDWRVVRALSDSDADDPMLQAKGSAALFDTLLGRKGTDALADHVKDKNGFVSTQKMVDELTEIIGACAAGKKS